MILSTHPAPKYKKGLTHLDYVIDVHSWEALAKAVTREDYTWSPIVWKGGRRLQQYFQQAQALVLDIDDGLTIEEAKKLLDELGYIYLIGTTKSHQKIKHEGTPKEQPACDRYRIIVPAVAGCKDLRDYKYSLTKMAAIFKGDNSATDGARYFFRCSEIVAKKEEGKKFTWLKNKEPKYDSPPKLVTGRITERAMSVLYNEWEGVGRHETLFHTAASMRRFGIEPDEIIGQLRETNLYKELLAEDGAKELCRTINNAINAKET